MSLLRLIARLDIKGASVVKGVQMEGLRVVGKPEEMAKRYAEAGADEILYIDTVASLYGRNQLEALLEKTCEEVFVPITVGGGIKSVADARRLFNAGADKIAINTAALKRPDLINEMAGKYGSQAVVVSIEAKRSHDALWECYCENGRARTGRQCAGWAMEAVARGAGEILITSIDRDGTRRGFDTELVAAIAPHIPVPVTASGGCGGLGHLKAVLAAGADAVAIGSALHYGKVTFEEMREAAKALRPFPCSLNSTQTRTALSSSGQQS